MIEVGIANEAISVERKFHKKIKTTTAAKDRAENEMLFDGVQRRLDKFRLITDDGDLYVRR